MCNFLTRDAERRYMHSHALRGNACLDALRRSKLAL